MSNWVDEKYERFALGAFTASGSFLLSGIFISFISAVTVSAGMVAVAAVAKEVYEHLHNKDHIPDTFDALATSLGGFTVLLPIIFV